MFGRLIKDSNSAIVISDDQIDETGKIVREPVLVFSVGGEKMGYVPIRMITTFEMVKVI